MEPVALRSAEISLNSGHKMPLLGFGTFAGGEGEASVVERYLERPLSAGGAMQALEPRPEWEVAAEAAVDCALARGYRHIDTGARSALRPDAAAVI